MTLSKAGRASRRLLTVGVPVLAAGLVLTACSSSGSAVNPGSSGGSTTASTTTSKAAAVRSASAAGVKISAGHLTDNSGRTVYLWAADTGATSTCSGTCLKFWPAVPASGTPSASGGAKASDLSTIKRADGGSQLAYGGHPLYYFAEDTAPGEAKGQGSDSFGAKWWELDSSGRAIDTAVAPATGHSSSSSSGRGGGGYGY